MTIVHQIPDEMSSPAMRVLRCVVVALNLLVLFTLASLAGAIYLQIQGPTDYIAHCFNISVLIAAGLTINYAVLHQAIFKALDQQSWADYRRKNRSHRRVAVGYLVIMTIIWTIAVASGFMEAHRSTFCSNNQTVIDAWQGINNCKVHKVSLAVAVFMILLLLALLCCIGMSDDVFHAHLFGISSRTPVHDDEIQLSTEPMTKEQSSSPSRSAWPLHDCIPPPVTPRRPSSAASNRGPNRDSWLPPLRFRDPPWEQARMKSSQMARCPSQSTSQTNLLPSPLEAPSSLSNYRIPTRNPRMAFLKSQSHMTVSSSLYSCPTPTRLSPPASLRESSELSYFSDFLDASTNRTSAVSTRSTSELHDDDYDSGSAFNLRPIEGASGHDSSAQLTPDSQQTPISPLSTEFVTVSPGLKHPKRPVSKPNLPPPEFWRFVNSNKRASHAAKSSPLFQLTSPDRSSLASSRRRNSLSPKRSSMFAGQTAPSMSSLRRHLTVHTSSGIRANMIKEENRELKSAWTPSSAETKPGLPVPEDAPRPKISLESTTEPPSHPPPPVPSNSSPRAQLKRSETAASQSTIKNISSSTWGGKADMDRRLQEVQAPSEFAPPPSSRPGTSGRDATPAPPPLRKSLSQRMKRRNKSKSSVVKRNDTLHKLKKTRQAQDELASRPQAQRTAT